ncbi:MAG: hypothetical protein ACOCUQ_00380 [Bacteroidota bacterium]
MSRIKNRTATFRARIKKNIENGNFSHEKMFKNYLITKDQKQSTILEMWENYLIFDRLEF